MGKTVLYEGPDISKHNGTVNVKKVRDAGYQRIGIRVGYGKNNIDQKFVSNALACFNLGVSVLLYWFSYAYTVAMAQAEAQYCIAQAKKYWSKCPITFDFEYDSVNYARKKGVNITKKLATDMAIAFLCEVRNAGYIPVLYTNRDYAKNYFDLKRIAQEAGTYYVWYARYNSTMSEDEYAIADVWQYTSKGRIPGVSGNVDLNKFFMDFNLPSVPASNQTQTKNINILDFQKAANRDGYRDSKGRMLVEDGLDGANTQYVRKKIALKAKYTVLGYKVGSTGNLVSYVQRRCKEILGESYTAKDIDGKYGKDTRKDVIAVQKKLNLTADGIAGYNFLSALFYN